MNVPCKAMTGLLAAGVAVVRTPGEAVATNQVSLPRPITYSTAGLFTPLPQSATLTIPLPASTARYDSSLSATMSGSRPPDDPCSHRPDFRNSSDYLVDRCHYDCCHYDRHGYRDSNDPDPCRRRSRLLHKGGDDQLGIRPRRAVDTALDMAP